MPVRTIPDVNPILGDPSFADVNREVARQFLVERETENRALVREEEARLGHRLTRDEQVLLVGRYRFGNLFPNLSGTEAAAAYRDVFSRFDELLLSTGRLPQVLRGSGNYVRVELPFQGPLNRTVGPKALKQDMFEFNYVGLAQDRSRRNRAISSLATAASRSEALSEQQALRERVSGQASGGALQSTILTSPGGIFSSPATAPTTQLSSEGRAGALQQARIRSLFGDGVDDQELRRRSILGAGL